MPTLPAFTTSRRSTWRANGMCVCPQTTVRTSSDRPVNTSVQRLIGLSTSTISSSSRGVAWQNSVEPMVTLVGSVARNSTCSALSWSAAQRLISYGVSRTSWRAIATISRSPLPRTQTARSPNPCRRSSVSTGCGPPARSPASTTTSALRTSGSARTASSAGSTPWMSASTAMRSMPTSLARQYAVRAARLPAAD
jgi:hypothetical protein